MARKPEIKEPSPGFYLPVPHMVMDSLSWQTASDKAIRMLLDLARSHNGLRGNNGHLSGARSYLKRRGWRSVKKIQSALWELQELGLIQQTKAGGLNMGSNLYAVTWTVITNFKGLDISVFQPGAWRMFDYKAKQGFERACLTMRQDRARRGASAFSLAEATCPTGSQEIERSALNLVSQGGTKNISHTLHELCTTKGCVTMGIGGMSYTHRSDQELVFRYKPKKRVNMVHTSRGRTR